MNYVRILPEKMCIFFLCIQYIQNIKKGLLSNENDTVRIFLCRLSVPQHHTGRPEALCHPACHIQRDQRTGERILHQSFYPIKKSYVPDKRRGDFLSEGKSFAYTVPPDHIYRPFASGSRLCSALYFFRICFFSFAENIRIFRSFCPNTAPCVPPTWFRKRCWIWHWSICIFTILIR